MNILVNIDTVCTRNGVFTVMEYKCTQKEFQTLPKRERRLLSLILSPVITCNRDGLIFVLYNKAELIHGIEKTQQL